MLQRLIGLETEYATLIRPSVSDSPLPSRRSVYESVCQQITRRLPTARGRYDADTIFLANGGAFSLESSGDQFDKPGGLIEGATAETTSPSRLVECQRAQDQLIAEAAESCSIAGTVRIFKNSCDAQGHVYGCQENYSAPVATGIWLLIFRVAVLLTLPLAMMYWVVCISVLAFELGLILGSRLVSKYWYRWFVRSAGESHSGLVNHDSAAPVEEATAVPPHPVPDRLLSLTAIALRTVNWPTAVCLSFIGKHVAFRRQRKYLTTFLVSRVVLTGAGHVDRRNRYRLSSKAMATNVVTGLGGYMNERPIYVFQHWLQQLCGRSLLSRRSATDLFSKVQRLQIGLSDSNVSDTAEFLKVGTTSLVLDMIEAGETKGLPRLSRPVEALHRIASDWNLVSRVATNQGELSGLDIQRRYLKACQQYVRKHPLPADHEAHQVLRRWEATIEALAAFRSSTMDPLPALGHVDWLTKKWMLDRLDETSVVPPEQASHEDATTVGATRSQRWAARKKVDIRYHELCDDGYFAKLRGASPQLSSVDPAGVDVALRMPPTGSPACRRGQLIREFADGSEEVAVDWSHVVIGAGRDRRVVSVT